MRITRNSTPTTTAPAERFTGTVYVDPITSPSAGSRLNASNVRFTPEPEPPGTGTQTAKRFTSQRESVEFSAGMDN